ncbi:hypothetical protein [Shewanella surugensis]|uniref:PspA/IM30 family protein n=1 Tax=Shewanella surugensis TaxID=212020 RepID=A0ABT0LJM7_9GAMM|nr:hypothetical protein [Shewanella surugensis]MCL1127883.1 hypothetical protein [Shewanella surugensis]
MSFLNKIKAQVTNLGDGVSATTSKLAGNVLTSSKENSKLMAIKAEIASIDGDLEFAYKDIGKKYIEHVTRTGQSIEFGVQDTLVQIAPKLDKKTQLENEAIEIEKALKDQLIMQEKAAFQNEFDEEQAKLDKALKMDVISKEEHTEKLLKAKKRVDNFINIRKIEKQFEMALISKDEKEQRIALLS